MSNHATKHQLSQRQTRTLIQTCILTSRTKDFQVTRHTMAFGWRVPGLNMTFNFSE